MPSTFPEAFGMVAAEAAACGALPLSADHSGMAEVTATLAPALPEELRPLLSFDVGPRRGGARSPRSWSTGSTLDPAERERARAALAAEAARRYSLGERRRGGDRGRPGTARRALPVRPPQRIVFPPREPRPEHGQAACSAAARRGCSRRCRWRACGARRARPVERQGAVRAEVRLLPRARPRRHAGHTGARTSTPPSTAALADGIDRDTVQGIVHGPDPPPAPQQHHAGGAGDGRRRPRRGRLRRLRRPASAARTRARSPRRASPAPRRASRSSPPRAARSCHTFGKAGSQRQHRPEPRRPGAAPAASRASPEEYVQAVDPRSGRGGRRGLQRGRDAVLRGQARPTSRSRRSCEYLLEEVRPRAAQRQR